MTISNSSTRVRLAALLMGLAGMTALSGTAAAQMGHGAVKYPRQFGYITMKDGVQLAYVAYLPQAKGKFPAVLQYGPYQGGGTTLGWPDGIWLKNGYAMVFASVRGTGCSQGVFHLFGRHEGPDGAAIIRWIGTQPWSDRKVGMIGVSYPGFTQILVAAQHPRMLKAIAPSAVAANAYSQIVYPGGIFNPAFLAWWSLHGQPMGAALGVKARIGWGDTECAANDLAHPAPRLFAHARAHPFFDRWWRLRSLQEYIGRVEVPTFLSGTWQDNAIMASGTTDLYERLRAPKRLSMSPGGHGWVYLQSAFQHELVQWMNHWVKGVPDGTEARPPVTIYWQTRAGLPPTSGWATHYAHWPPKRTRARTFWLTSARTLSARRPGNSAADAHGLSYTFPTGVELMGNNTQFALPPDPNGSVTWTSAPLSQNLTLLGSVQVRLYAASQNRDTDFEVVLQDVYPNGDVQYLQHGFLRASLRALDPGKPRPDHLVHAYRKPAYLVPGRVYELQLSLPPLGAVLRKGHRLQLVIVAPSPIAQPSWGLMPVDLPGQNTIYASARFPSRIIVPTIPGAKAARAQPPCGSMPMQPCRKPTRPR